MVDLFGLQGQGAGLGDIVDDVDDAVQDIAGAEHLHQFTGTLHGGETVSFTFEDGSPFLEGYWKENHFYGTYYDEDGAHTLPAA